MSTTPDGGKVEPGQAQLANELAVAQHRIAELEASLSAREQDVAVLRDSEALYRSVVETVDIGLTLIGLDHRVILVNEAQGQLLGKPAAEFTGKYCYAEFERRDAICPHCPGIEALATGQPAVVETRGVRADGTHNWARLRAFPVLDAQGLPVGFIEIVEDINERKLAEEQRRESEDRFRILMEYAADAFFLHDADMQIVDVNRHACESLGYTREELLQMRVEDFDVAFGSQVDDNWRRLVQDRPETVEREHRRRDGTTFPVEVRLGVIESGESRFYLALARDITARKQVDQMLARRTMLLETGSEVARAAGSIVDPDELMSRVVDLIRERFDLYYVGLFLVDQAQRLYSQPGEWAYLRAATGEEGEAMLKQNFRLRVGTQGMIGQCIAEAKSRVSLDSGQDAGRLINPLLPLTRSELALPLINRGQAIGALTIQSIQPMAFSQEDVAALEIMAGQIANSIENARLFKATQAALEELKGTHGRYIRQEWGRFLGTSSPPEKKP